MHESSKNIGISYVQRDNGSIFPLLAEADDCNQAHLGGQVRVAHTAQYSFDRRSAKILSALRQPFIVLDFETTGLSPTLGARATEVAAVLVRDGKITDKFQSLMNPGVSIPPFIEEFTGITNRMISKAPPSADVMCEFLRFIGDTPLVAHNASFDKKFLDAELCRIGRQSMQPMACSMRIARRVYQNAPNHRLGTLVKFAHIETDGVFHRALADSEMTARLMLKMAGELRRNYGLQQVNFELMQRVQSMVIRDMPNQLSKMACKYLFHNFYAYLLMDLSALG